MIFPIFMEFFRYGFSVKNLRFLHFIEKIIFNFSPHNFYDKNYNIIILNFN